MAALDDASARFDPSMPARDQDCKKHAMAERLGWQFNCHPNDVSRRGRPAR